VVDWSCIHTYKDAQHLPPTIRAASAASPLLIDNSTLSSVSTDFTSVERPFDHYRLTVWFLSVPTDFTSVERMFGQTRGPDNSQLLDTFNDIHGTWSKMTAYSLILPLYRRRGDIIMRFDNQPINPRVVGLTLCIE
jgi:hypothetical protein